MKSEPDAYSIDTLKNDGVTLWDLIINYQARNFMRKMKKGDKVFFYHSNFLMIGSQPNIVISHYWINI